MAIKLGQSLKQSQNLTMTPQLQQAIKMLTMTHLEMADIISQEMVENPILEESDKEYNSDDLDRPETQIKEKEMVEGSQDQFDWDSYVESYNNNSSTSANGTSEHVSKDDFVNYENMVSSSTSLAEHLEWQLRMENLNEGEWKLAFEIIHNINDDGYLETPFSEIRAKFVDLDDDECQMILEMIHSLDPIGCACYTLQECLSVQAMHIKPTPHLALALIKDHLEDIKDKKYEKISEAIGARISEIQNAEAIISSFIPKPGRLISPAPTQYIVPDIYIRLEGDQFQISLNNEGIPHLRVSKLYQELMKQPSSSGSGEAKDYLKEKLRSAMWLIKSIENRQKTIEKVAKAIVDNQPDFFSKGASHLKPMILKDIAEEIGVHESTVSRATTNKFMHTPLGIFELKYFFNAGIGGKNGGVDIASEGLKLKIKELIDQENIKKPISDQKIAELLSQDNVVVARRTVAKYREMMDIPSSAKRKKS